MSAFVVSSMMGIYPEVAGIPVYVIGSPVFKRVEIKHPNGKTFTIEAKNNSRYNKYIQSVKLNGKPQNKLWLRHADIVKGERWNYRWAMHPIKVWVQDPLIFHPLA